MTAELRDFSGANVTAGNRLAAEKGLQTVSYQQGDAFDRAALASVSKRPDIAIVSGLYELFPENGPVRESLSGLAKRPTRAPTSSTRTNHGIRSWNSSRGCSTATGMERPG